MVKSPVLRSPGQILVNHWLSALSGAMRRLWFASSFRISTERASSLGMEDCFLEIWSSRCVCALDLTLRHCTVGVNRPGFDSTCCHGLHHLLFRGEVCEDSACSQFFSKYTVACKSLGTPCRICENVNNFNKIREIIQNACYFLFSTVLSKIFYIKYVYI